MKLLLSIVASLALVGPASACDPSQPPAVPHGAAVARVLIARPGPVRAPKGVPGRIGLSVSDGLLDVTYTARTSDGQTAHRYFVFLSLKNDGGERRLLWGETVVATYDADGAVTLAPGVEVRASRSVAPDGQDDVVSVLLAAPAH